MFQGSWSPEMVDGPRGPWSIRREPERKRGGGEREGGGGEVVESDTAFSLWEQKTKTKVRGMQY